MRTFRLIFLAGFLSLNAYGQTDAGLLQFDGFTISSKGFNVKRDAGTVAGQNPAVILYLTPTEGFAPNVNVLIQEFPGSIGDYVSTTKKEFASAGITMLNERSVSPTEWMVEYAGVLSARSLHFYARVVQSGDKVYLTTGTATPEQWDQFSSLLKQCVDSFAVTTKVPQPAQ